jgi:tRNA (cytidine32/guanosine34-2'-O)-methyltransferase
VAKMFRSSKEGVETLYSRVNLFFKDVVVAKPRSSRASSIESFIVAREFTLPPGYTPSLHPAQDTLTPIEKLIIPFVTCGDLEGFDGDTSYSLPEG